MVLQNQQTKRNQLSATEAIIIHGYRNLTVEKFQCETSVLQWKYTRATYP
ncbi:hypothetical protein HanRHA438_Chr03g0113131 [Helianthus annuus]|nr:hypothetical protein HanRHA438_Chr03g0113131 [Helianthus annuus]